MRNYRPHTSRLSSGLRVARLHRRVTRMRAGLPSFLRTAGVKPAFPSPRRVETKALTVTADLKVVAVTARKSVEVHVTQPNGSGENEELIINGDPNEVVKTLSARRSLEVAYGSDTDEKASCKREKPEPKPIEERKIMEKVWGSTLAASTSETTETTSGRRRIEAGRRRWRRTDQSSWAEKKTEGKQLDDEIALMSQLENTLREETKDTKKYPSAGLWFRRLSPTLLTLNEERVLGRIIQRGQVVAHTRLEMKRQADGETPSEEELAEKLGLSIKELRKQWKRMERARWLLVAHNLRSVVPIARALQGSNNNIELADLLAAGRDGLVRAADRFNPSRGRFATYAHLWVKQSIQRCLREESRVIHLPAHVCENLTKIYKYCQSVPKAEGSHLTTSSVSTEEISEAVGIPEAKVKTYMRASKAPVSFDAGLTGSRSGEDGRQLHELIADSQSTADEVINKSVIENLNIALSTLTPRERNIIRMRYGLCGNGMDSMTFKEIGTTYGLSKERIRKIENSGMQKLRKPWRRALLQIPEVESKLS